MIYCLINCDDRELAIIHYDSWYIDPVTYIDVTNRKTTNLLHRETLILDEDTRTRNSHYQHKWNENQLPPFQPL